MSGKSIQLRFGVVRDKSMEKWIKLNLSPNYRKDVLFDHLPYLSHLENPAIKDVVRDHVVDNIALQKYLLVTGLLKYSIQNSLNMIVTDAKFNNAGIRRELDTKDPTIMKKPNPIDVAFKDTANFDTQNLVIGKLLPQIQTGKNDKALQKQLENAPSIKDLEITEKLELLKQFNNNNNNEDDNDDASFVPPPRLPSPPFLLLAYPSSIDSNESNTEGENPVQNFLLGWPQRDRSQCERIAVGEKTSTAAPNKVKFSENLSKVFPKADKFFDNELKNGDINYDELSDVTIPNTQSLFKKLNDGKTPDELTFSSGGNESANALKFHAMKNVVSLYESNENFWDYLSSDFRREILLKNKMKIHLDSGNI